VPYSLLKQLHITFALVSVTGFVLRWLWLMKGSALSGTRWVRITPHVIDTLLLASGIMLLLITAQFPWSTPWLGAKLIGLVIYILSGMAAMSAQSRARQIVAFVFAISVFGWIISAAWLKSPLGWLAL